MAYKLKVVGEYIKKTDANTKIIEFYDEEFIVDIDNQQEALSFIKNGLLHQRLYGNEKYKGYVRFRTHEPASFEKTEEKADNSEFSKLVMQATDLGCMPTNIDMYTTQESKTKVIKSAIKADKMRKAKAKKKEQKTSDLGYVD